MSIRVNCPYRNKLYEIASVVIVPMPIVCRGGVGELPRYATVGLNTRARLVAPQYHRSSGVWMILLIVQPCLQGQISVDVLQL